MHTVHKHRLRIISLLLSIFITNIYVSADCPFPTSYTSKTWFTLYTTSKTQAPNSTAFWIYGNYSTTAFTTSRVDNASQSVIVSPCTSYYIDTTKNYVYYVLPVTGSGNTRQICSKATLTSEGTALILSQIMTATGTISAQDCVPLFTESCYSVNPLCSTVWYPSSPLPAVITSPAPAFSPAAMCPFSGTYQLSVTQTNSDCVGNSASTASVSASSMSMNACTNRTLYKFRPILNEKLTCLGNLPGDVLNSEESANGVNVLLLMSADNITIFCAKYNIGASGTVLMSIDVRDPAYASCNSFSFNTASNTFVALTMTPITATTVLPNTPTPSTVVLSNTPFPSSPILSTIAASSSGASISASPTSASVSSVSPTSTSVPPTSTSVPATSTSVAATSTSVPTTSTSVLPTSTSVPATSTSVPATSTSVPTTSTSVLPTSTSVPATSTSVPATSTSVPTTSTSVLPTSTSVPSTSTSASISTATVITSTVPATTSTPTTTPSITSTSTTTPSTTSTSITTPSTTSTSTTTPSTTSTSTAIPSTTSTSTTSPSTTSISQTTTAGQTTLISALSTSQGGLSSAAIQGGSSISSSGSGGSITSSSGLGGSTTSSSGLGGSTNSSSGLGGSITSSSGLGGSTTSSSGLGGSTISSSGLEGSTTSSSGLGGSTTLSSGPGGASSSSSGSGGSSSSTLLGGSTTTSSGSVSNISPTGSTQASGGLQATTASCVNFYCPAPLQCNLVSSNTPSCCPSGMVTNTPGSGNATCVMDPNSPTIIGIIVGLTVAFAAAALIVGLALCLCRNVMSPTPAVKLAPVTSQFVESKSPLYNVTVQPSGMPSGVMTGNNTGYVQRIVPTYSGMVPPPNNPYPSNSYQLINSTIPLK